MKIAILGGSFDPVHNEHVRLAQAAIEQLELDRLFVMPAHIPPHKPEKALCADEDRLEMCRLAFEDVDKAMVSAYEIAKGGTSYTRDTCEYLRFLYPDAEIFWLVGTDMLRDFPTWKDPERILQLVTLAVCGRNESGAWWEKEQAEFYTRFGKNFKVVEYNGADVSSTRIRILAGAGMRLTEYTSEKVARYICGKQLYKIPHANTALGLEKDARQAHSVRVAELAATRAAQLNIPERKVIEAALFHDCAKNLSEKHSYYLKDFKLEAAWGDVPAPVLHQYTGAYVAAKFFGVTDEDVLNAIRFHTSARPAMSELEKLIFLADMLEEERSYEGVEVLRELFWKGDSLDECLEEALRQTLEFLQTKGSEIYPLTQAAYDFYKKLVEKEGTEASEQAETVEETEKTEQTESENGGNNE